MGKIDWPLVEADFLVSGLSYSRLAEKHGLSLATLKRRAAAEHWQEKRRRLAQRESALMERLEPEVLEPEELALERRQDRRARLQDTADRMLDKLRGCMEELKPGDAYALTCLVRALKDLRELQGLHKDALDIEEQLARIEKLHSESRSGEEESPGGVVLIPETAGELLPPEQKGAEE